MAKTLVIYYSRTGENYVNGSVRSLSKGNTEVVAKSQSVVDKWAKENLA